MSTTQKVIWAEARKMLIKAYKKTKGVDFLSIL